MLTVPRRALVHVILLALEQVGTINTDLLIYPTLLALGFSLMWSVLLSVDLKSAVD